MFFCSFGTPYQKPTALVTNVKELERLGAELMPCRCVRPHAERLEWDATSKAAAYPPAFAEAVARGFKDVLPKWRDSLQKGASLLLAVAGVLRHRTPVALPHREG